MQKQATTVGGRRVGTATKIFISVDIEGVAGVVNAEQGRPGNAEHEAARRLMTAEANAAIEGAIAGGASEVLVNDSHGPMRNLVLTELDPQAQVVYGRPKPLSMMQGLESDFAGVILLGYHARAGAHRGILAHTINGFAFAKVSVNGRAVGEAALYGSLAGAMGVPVIMASGDDVLRAEVAQLFPDARFAEVKLGIGANAAKNLSPKAARALIRSTAEAATREAHAARPSVMNPPLRCEVRLNTPALADLMSLVPGTERIDGHTVAFTTDAILDTIRILNVMSAMSASLR